MEKKVLEDIIEKITALSKLQLSSEEKKQAKKDLKNLLDCIDKLDELDTEDIKPMAHVFPLNNVFREDVVKNENRKEEMLTNAPEQKNGYFNVPITIE